MGTQGTGVCSPTSQDNGSPAAPARAKTTQAQSTPTARMSDGARLKLTCLKHRYVCQALRRSPVASPCGSLSCRFQGARGRFRSPGSGHHLMPAIRGSTHRTTKSSPTHPSLFRTHILGVYTSRLHLLSQILVSFPDVRIATATILNFFPDQECYEGNGGCFSVYGVEYKPGFDNAVSLYSNRRPAYSATYSPLANSTLAGSQTTRSAGL